MEMGFPFIKKPDEKKVEYAEDPFTGTLEEVPVE
jgi:hypothetical protein